MSSETTQQRDKPGQRRQRTLLIVLVTLLGVAITCSLGFWQLRRAAAKEVLQTQLIQRGALPALEGQSLGQLGDTPENRSGLIHRAVQLQGQWLTDKTLFLDNRQMKGRVGFFVMTPLQLTGSKAVILVQRGWAPRHFTQRTELPEVVSPTGEVAIRGRIAPAPSKLYELGASEEGPIRQNLDLDALRQETGLALLEITVVQTGDPSEGLLREWPQPLTGVEKHYGYAFQWFGLSALITMLYVWFQIVRPYIPSKKSN
jgi:surfeit locus 1 family protein